MRDWLSGHRWLDQSLDTKYHGMDETRTALNFWLFHLSQENNDLYIKNFAWEDQSEKVFYKCQIYTSVLYCVVIEHPSVLYLHMIQ